MTIQFTPSTGQFIYSSCRGEFGSADRGLLSACCNCVPGYYNCDTCDTDITFTVADFPTAGVDGSFTLTKSSGVCYWEYRDVQPHPLNPSINMYRNYYMNFVKDLSYIGSSWTTPAERALKCLWHYWIYIDYDGYSIADQYFIGWKQRATYCDYAGAVTPVEYYDIGCSLVVS